MSNATLTTAQPSRVNYANANLIPTIAESTTASSFTVQEWHSGYTIQVQPSNQTITFPSAAIMIGSSITFKVTTANNGSKLTFAFPAGSTPTLIGELVHGFELVYNETSVEVWSPPVNASITFLATGSGWEGVGSMPVGGGELAVTGANAGTTTYTNLNHGQVTRLNLSAVTGTYTLDFSDVTNGFDHKIFFTVASGAACTLKILGPGEIAYLVYSLASNAWEAAPNADMGAASTSVYFNVGGTNAIGAGSWLRIQVTDSAEYTFIHGVFAGTTTVAEIARATS